MSFSESVGPSTAWTNGAYRARWVFPVEGEPIEDGVVEVRDGRITRVAPAAAIQDAQHLGDVALIPSLVNAHTHLEFSSLESPLGGPCMPFTDWIKQVIFWRRERDQQQSGETVDAAIAAGIRECRAAGTATIGEIATGSVPSPSLNAPSLHGVAFYELIGLSRTRVEPQMERARELLSRHRAAGLPFVGGLSPHAPYSVHPDLLRQSVDLSRRERFPIAMHLAESEAELELLRTGTGPFRDLLIELGVWEVSAIRTGSRPLDYLKILAEADRSLIIHGNYLNEEEIRFLGQHRACMSVVYCPRTHHYFGHRPYPLTDMLAAGVRMALGTDSRASTPTLSVMDELRFAATQHRLVRPDTWLTMATLWGAEALGLDEEVGSLRPGKRANIAAIDLGGSVSAEPWSWLFDDRATIIAFCA